MALNSIRRGLFNWCNCKCVTAQIPFFKTSILYPNWEQWVLLPWRWPFPGVLVMCLITLFKCLTEATWKGKSLFWLPVPSETVYHGREMGQQEEEVTGYVASTVRKQRTQMLVFRQPSLLCLVQDSCPWKGTTHIYFPYIYTVSHRQDHSVFTWWLPCKQVENQD